MSIAITDNKVTYQGNGATITWPFSFPVLEKEHLQVILTNAAGAETTLASDYVVDLTSRVVTYPGYESGQEPPEINKPPKLPLGWKITLLRQVPLTQETDLGDRWPFKEIESMSDLSTMQIQQLAEEVGRCVKVGVTSIIDPTDLLKTVDEATTAAAGSASAAATSATQAAGSAATAANSATQAAGILAQVVQKGEAIEGGSIPVYWELNDDGNLQPVEDPSLVQSRFLPAPYVGTAPALGDVGKALVVGADATFTLQDVAAGTGAGTARSILVCIGDSITAGSPFYKSTTTPPTLAEDIYSWVAYIRGKLGRTVVNKGIGGQTSAELLARFDTDVIAQKPTHCIIECGINDCVQPEKLQTLEQTQANIIQMVTKCRTAGIVPLIMVPTPTRASVLGGTANAGIDAIRAWEYTYAASEGITLIDAYNQFIHATAGTIITSMLSEDLLHPSADGYVRLGQETLRILQNLLPDLVGNHPVNADKVTWMSSGTSPNKTYDQGDIIFSKTGSPGTAFAIIRTPDATKPFSRVASIRDIDSFDPNHVGYYEEGDMTNRHWELNDVILYNLTSQSKLRVYRVDVAGWTGGDHVNTPDRATLTLKAELPYAASTKKVNFAGIYTNTDLTNRYWEAGDLVFYNIPSQSKMAIYNVTVAGWTGGDHVNTSDRATLKLAAEIPWSTAPVQESWTYPGTENSWVNYGAPFSSVRYYKDSNGLVHLGGVAKNGSIGYSIMSLPAGYRPAATLCLPVVSGGTIGVLYVTSAGAVQPIAGASTSFTLDGITFRAEG